MGKGLAFLPIFIILSAAFAIAATAYYFLPSSNVPQTKVVLSDTSTSTQTISTCKPTFISHAFQCFGNKQQQLFQGSDCSEIWVDQQYCQFGCADGNCLTNSSNSSTITSNTTSTTSITTTTTAILNTTSTTTTSPPTECVYGTVTATSGISYVAYRIYSDLASYNNYARLVVLDASGKIVEVSAIGIGYPSDFTTFNFRVRIFAVRALQDGTVLGVDLSIGPIGSTCVDYTAPVTISTTTTSLSTTTTTSIISTGPYMKSGKYVDVDWSNFQNNESTGIWGVATGDSQYEYLAKIQDVPLNRIRNRTLVVLSNGIGGYSSGSNIGVDIDWFFGKNLISPNDAQSVGSPSYGMTPADYSLQRLDSEYYHELVHHIPVGCGSPCPRWFVEGLGSWAQDAVTQPGAYTGIKAQMEDSFYHDYNAYSNPDPLFGYGKTSAFFYWLIDTYGINGFHKMIAQCFGWDYPHIWYNQTNIDNYGFVPWTGKTLNQLSQDFSSSVANGYRINITKILNKIDWTTVSRNNVTTCPYSVCTYVNPNNIGGGFYINGQFVTDGGLFAFLPNMTTFTITPANVPGHTFASWGSARTVNIADSSAATTTVNFGLGGWDGTCVGNLVLNYQ